MVLEHQISPKNLIFFTPSETRLALPDGVITPQWIHRCSFLTRGHVTDHVSENCQKEIIGQMNFYHDLFIIMDFRAHINKK